MKNENEAVVLRCAGRIDSSNAKDFECRLLDALAQKPGAPLVLECGELDYISSAGLRVLLLAAKKLAEPPRLRDVSPEVFDILEMTGFSSFLNVEKRLRSIDVTGCELIGRGATAAVYRLDPDTIVKVYTIPNALETIRVEQARAKQAFLKGIPTAISYDAVRVGDSYGSVFELLNARTFSDLLSAEPERIDQLVGMHVELLRTIHGIEAEAGELPDCREIYLQCLAELGDVCPAALRQRLEARLQAMPRDLHLIHGDIHMKNVMLCGGEPLLIDMETLCTGNPVFDLADLFVAYVAFNEADHGNSDAIIGMNKPLCDAVWAKTLRAYLSGMDDARFARAEKQVETVAYIRFLHLVAVMRFGGEALIERRVRDTIEKLWALTDEVEDFAI